VLNVSEPQEGNTTINSTLRQARTMFSRRAMAYLYGDIKLPDVTGFMTEPMLPVEDAEPDPVREREFAAMMAAAAEAPEEIALVNMILRQTGLRSGSVEALRADWLEQMRDGYWLHVRVRKGRTAMYSVPITEELAAKILERKDAPAVVLPEGTAAQRHELVHKAHNEWLKRIIGGSGERVQGNHRLRDTVATALLSWLGMEAAKLALGHADEKTTQRHCARLRMDVSEEMKAELVAWTRLSPLPARAS
jgi:integrase